MPRTNERIQQMLKKPIDPVYREIAVKLKEQKEEIFPRLLGKLMTLEEAEVMNALPASSEDIAKKLNLDKGTVEKDLQILFEKGLLYPGRSGWHLIHSYGALRDAAGASNPKYINDDFVDLTFAFSDERNNQTIEDIRRGTLKSVRLSMRVVPRWKAIKDIPGLLPYEDVREIFKGREPIVVVPCACKVVDRNRKCKDKVPVDSCVVVGKAAQYNLNRGTGKRITYDEALKLFDKFDELSLVHLVGNSTTMPNMVCNCHNCCCGVFYRTSKLKPQVNQIAMAKSRFIATVDPANCRSCKKCVAMCPIGAAQIKYYAEFGGERAYIDSEECIGCGLCVVSCTAQARAMKMVRPPGHIPTPDAGAIADAAE